MKLVADQIANFLQKNCLGVIGTDIFCGYLPSVDRDVICVRDTGGVAPEDWADISNPTFQIFIKTSDFEDGKQRVDKMEELLTSVKNQIMEVNTIHYFFIEKISGGYLGLGDNGMNLFSLNFLCKVKQAVYVPQIETGSPIGLLLSLTYQL